VVLLWLYVSGIALLIGAELNSEIEHASPLGKAPGQKTLAPPVPEPIADTQAPWPSSPAMPPTHGPALGVAAAAVILGVRAFRVAAAAGERLRSSPPDDSPTRHSGAGDRLHARAIQQPDRS
jgi:hypothetical protein